MGMGGVRDVKQMESFASEFQYFAHFSITTTNYWYIKSEIILKYETRMYQMVFSLLGCIKARRRHRAFQLNHVTET